MNLVELNNAVAGLSPSEVVSWALKRGSRPILTTNFGPYESSLLHLVTRVLPAIPVIWCDSGYNTQATYRHAESLRRDLDLNLFTYLPRQSAAHWEAVEGGVPSVDDDAHPRFTELVKLEPFRRALEAHRPDVWFTNIRRGQTAFRDTLDIVTDGGDGLLRVSPLFNHTDADLDTYLDQVSLTTEHDYTDPTKALAHRECGLHLRGAPQE